MKYTTITQLLENGFNVTKTKELNTLITHKKPFIIHGNLITEASSIDNEYSLTLIGLCSTGKLPYIIEQHTTPFIRHLDGLSKKPKHTFKPDMILKERILFDELPINSKFYLNEKSNVLYKKTTETTACIARDGSFVSDYETYVKGRMVITEQVDLDTEFSNQQIHDLVLTLPEGLGQDEFHEEFGLSLEHIPGIELFNDEKMHQIHQIAWSIYQKIQ